MNTMAPRAGTATPTPYTPPKGTYIRPVDMSLGAFDKPDLSSPIFSSFVAQARSFAGDSVGVERARKLSEFVSKYFTYDDNHARGFDLIEVIENKKGVCRDYSGALILLLRSEGFNAESDGGFVTIGRLMVGAHAWVKVSIDGVNYLADPTNSVFGKYSDFSIERQTVPMVYTKITPAGPMGLLRKVTYELIETNETYLWDWLSRVRMTQSEIDMLNAMEKELEPLVKAAEADAKRLEALKEGPSRLLRKEAERNRDGELGPLFQVRFKSIALGEVLYTTMRERQKRENDVVMNVGE